MPGDRPNQSGPGRPLVPTLASNRAAKTPFTPKLATKANTIGTPGSRPPASNQNGGLGRGGLKEEQSTPVRALLNNNITPRSSSRRSRVDSSQTTPTSVSGDTPNGGRAKSPSQGRSEGLTGLGITDSPSLLAARPKSQVSGLRISPAIGVARAQNARGNSRPLSEVIDRDDSPNFFHANDARTQNAPLRQPEPKKASTFFYADGREEDHTRNANFPSPAISADDKPKVPSKFFHADGSADQTQAFPLLSPPISTTSSRSSFISSPTQAVPPLLPNALSQPSQAQAASPPKENIHLSYRKGASQIIPSNASRRPLSSASASTTPPPSSQSHFDANATPHRRSSAASSTFARSRPHTKTASMSSIDVTPRKSSSLQNSSPLSPSTANSSSNPISPSEQVSTAQKPTAAISPTSNAWPRSPTKSALDGSQDSNDGNAPNLSELAAKARHDRKVLDLEISNSSLLAINRSLEREIRKQKAELRRFRRITRKSSIRNFSVASSTTRLTSYGTVGDDSGIDSLGEGVEGLGFEEEDFEDDDFDSEDYSEDSDDEGGEGEKEMDAKRLRLDLSKHREILVDSQKLNQSIKRCVGFTEELISQGKRALEYRVRVSDVKLGGRVLSEDEDERDANGLHEQLEDEVEFDESELGATNGNTDLKDGGTETNGLLSGPLRGPNRRTVSFGSVLSGESNENNSELNGAAE